VYTAEELLGESRAKDFSFSPCGVKWGEKKTHRAKESQNAQEKTYTEVSTVKGKKTSAKMKRMGFSIAFGPRRGLKKGNFREDV